MDRTGVLNRVGGLQLLSKNELATTKQVAELYDIEILSRYKVLVKLNRFDFEVWYNNNRIKLLEAFSEPERIDSGVE